MPVIQVERTPGVVVNVNVVDGFPDAMRTWAIVTGHLLDDATGLTVLAGVAIVLEPDVATLGIKFGADGWFALTGRPLRLFPGLAAQAYPIRFTIYAAGYQSMSLLPALPVQPGFPATFANIALGDIRLLPA